MMKKVRLHREGVGLLVSFFPILTLACWAIFIFVSSRGVFILTLLVSPTVMGLALNFFHFPRRSNSEAASRRLIVAPANGKVVVIEEVEEPELLGRRCLKLSIFMSPYSVHANWVTCNGMIIHVEHRSGTYYKTFLPESSVFNEHSAAIIHMDGGHEVLEHQIAEAVARHTVTYLKVGDEVTVEGFFGFTKLGSRIDLYLPPGAEVAVRIGGEVVGGEVTLGYLPQQARSLLYEDQNLVVMIKRLVPNLLMLCNILSGAATIISILCYKGYQISAIWIAVDAFFDLLDSIIVRLLHATSPIGTDLDSLSDMVTFGLTPVLLALCTIEGRLLASGYVTFATLMMSLPFLLILPFAAYRLVLSSNDTGTSNYFRGLPVPASALLWIGIPLPSCTCATGTLSLVTSYGLLLLSCILVVSRVSMLSLKHLDAQMKTSHGMIILIAWGAILVPTGCIYMWLGSAISTLRLAMPFYIIVSFAIGRWIKSSSDAIGTTQ